MLDVKSGLINESDWLKKLSNLVTLCKIRGRVKILSQISWTRESRQKVFFFTFSFHLLSTSYYLEMLKNPYRSHLCNFSRFWYFCASRKISLKFQFSPGFWKVLPSLFIFQPIRFIPQTGFHIQHRPTKYFSNLAELRSFNYYLPLYYLFFWIFLSEYCSLVVKVSFVRFFLEVLCWFWGKFYIWICYIYRHG